MINQNNVSILILLDYLFLFPYDVRTLFPQNGVSILILLDYLFLLMKEIWYQMLYLKVSILILLDYLFLLRLGNMLGTALSRSQSLFYWIIYSYYKGLYKKLNEVAEKVSILILLDYLFLYLG